jgi:hypothetical protein
VGSNRTSNFEVTTLTLRSSSTRRRRKACEIRCVQIKCSPKWETALIFISRQRSLLRSCKLSYCGTVECAACSFCDKRSPLRISLRMLIPASLQGVRADHRPHDKRAWLSGWKAQFFLSGAAFMDGVVRGIQQQAPSTADAPSCCRSIGFASIM